MDNYNFQVEHMITNNTTPGICNIEKNNTDQRIPQHIGLKFLTAGIAIFFFQKDLQIFKKIYLYYSIPNYSSDKVTVLE